MDHLLGCRESQSEAPARSSERAGLNFSLGRSFVAPKRRLTGIENSRMLSIVTDGVHLLLVNHHYMLSDYARSGSSFQPFLVTRCEMFMTR